MVLNHLKKKTLNEISVQGVVTLKSGDVIGRVAYDPYGEIVSKDEGIESRFLYNGQYGVQTDDNGLYHMRARYYNSELKRFMNRDIVTGSIGESQTLNRYAYVNGNPVSYHDPFGLARELLTRDNIQLALDFAGIVPGWGSIADLTNAGIYAWNGEWSEAGQSAFGAIPGVGDAATVAKISNKSSKIIDNTADSVRINNKIPSVKNRAFDKWFDDISSSDFNKLWSDSSIRAKISSRIRHPGKLHEWLLVSRTPVFKEWGVSMSDIKALRSPTKDVKFVNPVGIHGGKGSTKAHNELLDIIDNSKNYDQFVTGLNKWANSRLPNGINDLPEGLRR